VRFANDLVDEAMATLIAHGFDPVIRNGGKHVHVRWIDAGRPCFLIFSRTKERGLRARANARARLRRILRVKGLPQNGGAS
jgi:hypothetical protein